MKCVKHHFFVCSKSEIPVYLFCLLLLLLCYLAGRGVAVATVGRNTETEERRYKIVIDAGHGGIDPGKIGINGVEEQKINLKIAQKLKYYLEAQDVEVILTREGEGGLYDENASNKKVQDMKRRVDIIEQNVPDAVVSIHQNSYPEECVHGAQVFYFTGSRESKVLAEKIQQSLVEKTDRENHRKEKANDSYYLLKKTSVPIVIVECGFLSNLSEADKLCDELYQDRIAWVIHLAVLQYLNAK